MAFNILESSIFGGRPIELYEFYVLGQYWRYTNAEAAVVFLGAEFTPIPRLKRSSIKSTQNVERNEITISVRGDTPIAMEYLQGPPSEPVAVRIYQKHRDDPDYIVRYRGRVQNCSWVDNGATAELQCTQINWSLKQPGLRRSFQFACPYPLFEQGCNLNRNAFEVTATVTVINARVLTLSFSTTAYESNYFAGGYVSWTRETGRRDRRMILDSSSNTVRMQLTSIGLSVGDIVTLYPGCNHTTDACHSKFNNTRNYGGFPFIPESSPFAGTTLF